jgi:PBP1b-binding outer membrane lipoprotein LpoB
MGTVLIIAILAVVVFASGCTQQNQTAQNNTTAQPQNTTNVTKAIDVVAVQKGPETAKKGMNVTIQYEVTNNGNETVYNVQVDSQDFAQNIGTLKPGETKKGSSTILIPTDAEVQQDFGPNATVSNPYFIGGFSVTFNDGKGAKYSVLSNSIEIKLS